MSACPEVKLADVLHGLSNAGVILPVRDFLALTVKTSDDNLAAAGQSPA
jgi:hypothetical protein